jgi:leader peptidase (prepilin peptidase)/N-methyltransferase
MMMARTDGLSDTSSLSSIKEPGGIYMILALNLAENWPGILLEGIIGILVFLIGATVFSYLNVVIEELPRENASTPLLTRLTKGRSVCPHCGHAFKVKDSLPIFSWLIHKRKCIYCFTEISMRHTLIEILGGVLAVVSLIYYKISFGTITVFLVLTVLSAIAIIDADTQYIPPELNIILAVLGILSIWTNPGPTILQRIIGIFCISVPLLIIVWIIPDGFGGGDIKMMAAAGVLLGWKGNVLAFFIGLVLGGAYGAYLLATRKKGKKQHFAFGPFLSVGIAISMYAGIGENLMNRYLSFVAQMMQP